MNEIEMGDFVRVLPARPFESRLLEGLPRHWLQPGQVLLVQGCWRGLTGDGTGNPGVLVVVIGRDASGKLIENVLAVGIDCEVVK